MLNNKTKKGVVSKWCQWQVVELHMLCIYA